MNKQPGILPEIPNHGRFIELKAKLNADGSFILKRLNSPSGEPISTPLLKTNFWFYLFTCSESESTLPSVSLNHATLSLFGAVHIPKSF